MTTASSPTPSSLATLEQVQEYYGETLQTSSDLKTSACCSIDAMPAHVLQALRNVSPEVLKRFYGCGSPIPPAIEGRTILDLGCGTGRDVYVAAQIVGAHGRVIGVDMTEEQLKVANDTIDEHTQRFGFSKPNVEFKHGYIEDLASMGIADNSVDVVISNCVVNLSPDKGRVLSEIFRVLKPGGELLFSDVFAGRRVPSSLLNDPVLRGECLSGAYYTEDFRRTLRSLGCPDYRVLSSTRIALDNPEVEQRIGMVDFYSKTIRAFKLDSLEDQCEDYGQIAIYRGTIPHQPHTFDLDDEHRFVTGKPLLVCGNTASMLSETRLAEHFEVRGDRSTHYGLFDCTPVVGPRREGIPSVEGASGGCC